MGMALKHATLDEDDIVEPACGPIRATLSLDEIYERRGV